MLACVVSGLALLARSEATKDVEISGTRKGPTPDHVSSRHGWNGDGPAHRVPDGVVGPWERLAVRGVAGGAKGRGRLLAGHAGDLGGVVHDRLAAVRGVRGDGLGGALGLLVTASVALRVAAAHCSANSRWLASTFSAKSKYWSTTLDRSASCDWPAVSLLAKLCTVSAQVRTAVVTASWLRLAMSTN
jgi:hypothetical protein